MIRVMYAIVCSLIAVACGISARSAQATQPGIAPSCALIDTSFNSEEYHRRSMTEIIDNIHVDIDMDAFGQSPQNSILLEMGRESTFPSIIPMVYRGEFRVIPQHRLFAIIQWVRAPRPSMTDEDVMAVFKYEGLFAEGSATYWLPIQTSLAQAMQSELKPGSSVDIYLRWIGLARVEDTIDYVFTINAWRDPSVC